MYSCTVYSSEQPYSVVMKKLYTLKYHKKCYFLIKHIFLLKRKITNPRDECRISGKNLFLVSFRANKNLYRILDFSRENELRNLRMEINEIEGEPWEIGERMEEIANRHTGNEAQVYDNDDDDENEPDEDNDDDENDKEDNDQDNDNDQDDDNDPEDDNDQDDENESNEDQSDQINGSRLIENIFFEPPEDDDQLSMNPKEQVLNF